MPSHFSFSIIDIPPPARLYERRFYIERIAIMLTELVLEFIQISKFGHAVENSYGVKHRAASCRVNIEAVAPGSGGPWVSGVTHTQGDGAYVPWKRSWLAATRGIMHATFTWQDLYAGRTIDLRFDAWTRVPPSELTPNYRADNNRAAQSCAAVCSRCKSGCRIAECHALFRGPHIILRGSAAFVAIQPIDRLSKTSHPIGHEASTISPKSCSRSMLLLFDSRVTSWASMLF